MAIVQESLTINNKTFVRTYSDNGVKMHGGFPEADYDVDGNVWEPGVYGWTEVVD